MVGRRRSAAADGVEPEAVADAEGAPNDEALANEGSASEAEVASKAAEEDPTEESEGDPEPEADASEDKEAE